MIALLFVAVSFIATLFLLYLGFVSVGMSQFLAVVWLLIIAYVVLTMEPEK